MSASVVGTLLLVSQIQGGIFPGSMAQDVRQPTVAPVLQPVAAPGGAAPEQFDEYRVKAQYLHSLTRFITWPNEHALLSSSPLDICIYGYNPFKNHLAEISSLASRSHPIVVRMLDMQRSPLGCHILFVGAGTAIPPQLLSAATAAAGVLTVGENEDFIRQGGLVSLVANNNAVQVALNYRAARRAGFTVSGSLLDIAKKIE